MLGKNVVRYTGSMWPGMWKNLRLIHVCVCGTKEEPTLDLRELTTLGTQLSKKKRTKKDKCQLPRFERQLPHFFGSQTKP